LPPGTRFGELEILRVLGTGGFGIVYLARDHSLEREVALKEYMPGSLAMRGQGQRVSVRPGSAAETYALGLRSFVNEARLLARFNHPSLVKVYRFWEGNGTAYMVMPYLLGRTLRDVRRSMERPPTEAWIRSVLDPVMDALDLLHREGVYHRDIAPDNILLPPEEMPVLLDFGAARRAIGDSAETFTAILKPSYAPIEQYAEVTHLRQGPWTDLYALGAVVYYLLRGSPPPPATARAVQDDVTLLRPAENPGVSPQFLAAIEWALALRPADRPQHTAALREALDHGVVPPARTRSGTTLPPMLSKDDERTFIPTIPVRSHDDEKTAMAPTQPMSWARDDSPTAPDGNIYPPHARAVHGVESPTQPPRRFAFRLAGGGLLAMAAGVAITAAAVWAIGVRNPATAPVVASAPLAAPLPPSTRIVTEQPPPSPPVLAVAGTDVVSALSNTAASVPRPVAPKVTAEGSSAEGGSQTRSASTKQEPPRPHNARATTSTAAAVPSVVASPVSASPREACAGRTFLSVAACMEQQCGKSRFKTHPQCERVRAMIERRRRGEGG
jgi:serine/threonine protein kinase